MTYLSRRKFLLIICEPFVRIGGTNENFFVNVFFLAKAAKITAEFLHQTRSASVFNALLWFEKSLKNVSKSLILLKF